RPQRDDKILTDWNGLMIAALAKAGTVMGEIEYIETAERAAAFILKQMSSGDGRLLHRYRRGTAGIQGQLDDYAFMLWGLLELYEATFKLDYLQKALDLHDILMRHFRDPEGGGFFLTSNDSEVLIHRTKEGYDGALPSGNSASALNMVRLARITGQTDFEKHAAMIGRVFSDQVEQRPSGFAQLLTAVDFVTGPGYEVVIAGKEGAHDTLAMINAQREIYLPGKVVLFRAEGNTESLRKLAPYTHYQASLKGAATAYVCRGFVCETPTTDVGTMISQLDDKYGSDKSQE
ncbi:thioredoxin domain-containing protein, partial [Candidatus Neomarinimicrobiota bacterium]